MRLVSALRPRVRPWLLAGALPWLASCSGGKGPEEPLRVAAAADLAQALPEVAAAFEKAGGAKTKITFGSTGLLAKQIAEGAPFELFAAANVSFVDDVVKTGRCHADTKALYARGRIVVWTRADGPKVNALADLADARFAKIALANPEHAPYGRAAREALTKAGLWSSVEKKLVFGENVQQALSFAESGNADAAIVALSLAISAGGQSLAVEASEHSPLDQALVVCAEGERAKAAEAFAAFVNSPDGRAIMRRHGFLLPGETSASVSP